MYRRLKAFRSILLQAALMVCLSLCCCRVGALIGTLHGAQAGDRDAQAACVTGDSCCRTSHERSDDPEQRSDDESPSDSGCVGLCCIKGTTPDKSPKLPFTLSLVGTVPLAHDLRTAAVSIAHVSAPAVDPGPQCCSLLRQRCALII